MKTRFSRLQSLPMRKPLACVAAAVSVLLCSCAVGPDYKRPEVPKAEHYGAQSVTNQESHAEDKGGHPEKFVMGRDIAFAWWKVYQSPQLDALVEKALASNPTITAAQAALKQAQEYTSAQQGYFYPTIQAGFAGQRQKVSGNSVGSSGPTYQGNGNYLGYGSNLTPVAPLYYNWYTAQLSLSYTPDVFGLNRRTVESLKAQDESLRYQMEATYITLATNVVSAVIQEASLRSQIAATELFIKQNEEAVNILKKQVEYGYAMAIDLANQESSLAQARQLLPPMQKQLDQTRDLVRALVGATPDTSLDDNFNLSALHLPEELPLTLPSTLVEQRPDVRAAEEQLHAAVAGVGIAIANRLPQFTINGGMGGNANNLDWLFQTGGPFWSLTGGVMQTLFDGGTLRHRQSAAEEAVIQAEAQYKNTIITAFQNVADTLHAIQSDADSMKACNDAERSARTVQDVTAVQYREGYVNYLTLLQAQEAYQQATVTMIQAQTNRLGDVAALYQALGGGWWNRNNDANQMSRKGD